MSHLIWRDKIMSVVIPCGVCVEVDPWDSTTTCGNKQVFNS